MSEISLLTDDWPLLVSVCVGNVTDDDLDAYLEHFRGELTRRSGPYVSIVDLRAGSGLTTKQRQRLTHGMAWLEAAAATCVGTCLVFGSPLLRGVMTAVLWVRRPLYETQVFASVDEAKVWGRRKLRRSGAISYASDPPALR